GGAGEDFGNAIAVDSAGAAYVAGTTASDESTFLPKTGPGLTYNGGPHDAFIAKVKGDGSGFVFKGYIGGTGDDQANAIALDSTKNAYVAGSTTSDQGSFFVTVGPDLVHNGGTDAFVVKVKADGTQLLYAGYIGGSGDEWANAIAVDASNSAYVVGSTTSTSGFPIRVGPAFFNNGGTDAFVAKVKPDGTTLLYAGFIGGTGFDEANGIAVDSTGNAYIAGRTDSD